MQKNNPKIPKIFCWLLDLVMEDSDKSHLNGDYQEIFTQIHKNESIIKAYLWIFRQIIKSVIIRIIDFTLWSFFMAKNYLKIFRRNILKDKTYSFINILGLAIGFACCILIGLFVLQELSWDRFHENAGRIYRITLEDEVTTPVPLHRFMAEKFPEVESSTCFVIWRMSTLKIENKIFYEPSILATDNNFFEIFSFKLIRGDKNKALAEPNTVVLSRKIAEKYFGKENPVNKTIIINQKNFRITGVTEDIPFNSHFHTNFLVSLNSNEWYQQSGWHGYFATTYVLFSENVDYTEINRKLFDMETTYVFDGNRDHNRHFYLQPLKDIHLYSNLKFELEPNSDISNIYIFSTSAILVLLIACFNFMNIFTAKSAVRFREIGIRKTLGSNRRQLILQFFNESVLMSFISLLTGILLIILFLPVYGNLIGRTFEFSQFNKLHLLFGFTGLTLVVGIISGSYPAFFLSSLKPVNVLKGILPKGKKSESFRNTLVVFQFTVSIILVIGVMIISRQLNHLHSINLGFTKEQVLVIKNLQKNDVKCFSFKNEIKRSPNVISASLTGNIPGKLFTRGRVYNTLGKGFGIGYYHCDNDYLKTMQLEMKEGRFFSKEYSNESSSVILNEQAVKTLNLENPVGKTIFNWDKTPLKIIGVVKNFNFESLHKNIHELVLFPGTRKSWGVDYITVRLKTMNIKETINFIKGIWKSVNPDLPFEYSFLDEEYNSLYKNENRTGKIAVIFTLLAIFISCLGLFGLSSFIIQQRTKEIGVRKVLGASVTGIVFLLSGSLLKWIIVSFVLAVPAAWCIVNKWLQNFAFRINIEPSIFILAGTLSFLIGFMAVSRQTIKAARANPADVLKYE